MIVGSKEHPVRLSYVHLATPVNTLDRLRKQFSVQVIIDKEDKETLAKVNAAIQEAIQVGISEKLFNAALSKSPGFRRCLRDGDTKAAEVDDGSQDYLKGTMFFNAYCAEDRPPVVVDRFGRNYETASGNRKAIENELYPGCYALVSGSFYPYEHGKGGVGFGLNHVMKRKDGERLDGRISADAAFAELKDDMENDSGDVLFEGSEADLR